MIREIVVLQRGSSIRVVRMSHPDTPKLISQNWDSITIHSLKGKEAKSIEEAKDRLNLTKEVV